MRIPQKKATFKMLIELDKGKIMRESKFSYEDLQNAIKKALSSVNIVYENNFFVCSQYESVFASLASISKNPWIFDYIKKWDLYYENGNIEDLLR